MSGRFDKITGNYGLPENLRQNSRLVTDSSSKTVAGAKSKPTILMIGMHLTQTRGGISTLINEILNSKLRENFEFHYIASQSEDYQSFAKFTLALKALTKSILQLVRHDFAVVYVHVGSNTSLYRESVFIYLAKLFGKKVIAHFHAGDVDEYLPFQSRIGQKFIRKALNSANKLIAVSNESARQLRNLTGDVDIFVIPNAIATKDFNFPPRRKADGEPVRILFVGATGKLKGERDLLAALAELRKESLNIKVSLLGYGAENLRTLCEEFEIAQHIEFLGVASLTERIDFFRAADIFVLPTYAEAMPMSVIEAMSAGLPVISTPVGGIPELIDDGVEGFLVPPGDVFALAEKIKFLAGNSLVRLEMGEKAQAKARAEMDFEQYADKLREHLAKF